MIMNYVFRHHQLERLISLIFCLAVLVVMGINETVWSPFLPTVFAQNDISESTTGVVVAAYEVSYLVSSLLFMTVTNVDHRRITFCLFSVAAGIFIIIFGQLIFINSFEIFVATSILLRCFVGFAVGIYFCSGTSLLFSMFPNDAGKVFSYVSMSASLGFIFGTPFGSFFFGIGGYFLPFLASGALQILLPVVAFFVLPSKFGSAKSEPHLDETTVDNGIIDSKTLENKPDKETKLSAVEFLSNKSVICLSLAVISTTTSIGFVFVTFGPLLMSQFGIPEKQQGFYFLPFTITRAVIAPVFGYFTDIGFGGLSFTLFGCVLSSISLVLFTIPMFVDFFNNLLYMEGILILIGIGSSGALVPFVGLLRKGFEKSGSDYPEVINSYLSALYCVCYGLGATIGEVFTGGFLLEILGFHNSCFFQSFLCAVSGFISITFLVQNKMMFI